MKKTMLSITLLFLGANLLFAQESYFKFSMGYGLPAGSQMLAEKSSSSTTYSGYSGTDKGVYGSYGSGLAFNTSFGRMFSKNFGLDVNLHYLPGKKYHGSYSSTSHNYDGTIAGTSSETSSTNARALLFSPALVVTGGEGKMRPYAKIGIVVGTVKIVSESRYESTSVGSPTAVNETKMELTGGLPFGLRGGVGIDFGISKKVNFFSEVIFTSMSYYPKNGEVTENKINGVNQPPTPKVTFTRETTYNSNDLNSGTEQLRNSLPLGSLCMNIGMRIRLSSPGQ